MSPLSQETMLELMQYADGELDEDAAARARVEELLRTSEEARRVVEALGTLGDVVREGAEERADGGAANAIAGRVMAGIAAAGVANGESSSDGASGRVVPLARPVRRARSGAAPAVVAVLALAAGVVLFVRSQGSPSSSRGERYAAVAPPSVGAEDDDDSAPDGRAALAETEPLGVDLEEVRSVRNKVDVFFVPSAKKSGASVVVWINDRPGEH